MSDAHAVQVGAARRWLSENMPGDVKAAREARNRMILALDGQGYTQRVIADAVECTQSVVSEVLSEADKNGTRIGKRDPRGRKPKPTQGPEDDPAPFGRRINPCCNRGPGHAPTCSGWTSRDQLAKDAAQYREQAEPVQPWDMSGLYDPGYDLDALLERAESLAESIEQKKPTGKDAETLRAALLAASQTLQALAERI